MDRSTKIIIELLGKGTMNQAEIARTFEVSPSAISQIATKYPEEIAAMTADAKVAKIGTDSKIDRLEAQLLDKISTGMEFETDLRVLTGMFRVMNQAARRGSGETPTGTAGKQATATLQLNQRFIQQNITFVKDSYGQIVQVGDTTLATASADNVNAMALEHEVNTKALEGVQPDDVMPQSHIADESLQHNGGR